MTAGDPAPDRSARARPESARESTSASRSPDEAREPGGRVRWTAEADSPVLETPAVFGGRVFVSDAGGAVRALEAESGDQLWRAETDGPAALTVAADGLRPRLFAIGDRRVQALDAGTGDLLWSRSLQGRGGRTAQLTRPAFDGDRLYVGCHFRGVLQALDPGSGETVARSEQLGEWPSLEPAAVRGGDADGVYVGARDPGAGEALLYRLERATLEVRWRARLPAEKEDAPAPCPASAPVPLPGRGEVCWSAVDGRLVVLPAAGPETRPDGTAEPVCTTRLRNTRELCLPPAVAVGPGGRVYAAADAAGSDFGLSAPCLYALEPEADRTIRWFEHLDGSPYRATPAVAESGAVLLREATGCVRGIREVEGRVRNQILGTTPAGAGCSPALVGDTLITGTEDGRITALDISRVAGGGLAESPWPADRADARNTACAEG